MVVALYGAGAHADVLRLEELERRVLANNTHIDAQQAKLRRARAEEELARAARRPSVVARADGTLAPGGQLVTLYDQENSPFLVSGSRPFGDSDAFVPQARYSAGVGAGMTLYDFGRTARALEAARAKINAEQAGAEQVRHQLVLDVREAYARWLGADQSWRVASEQLERLETWRGAIDQLIAEGARPAADGALARFEEQRAALGVHRAVSGRDVARRALAALTESELPEDATPDSGLLETTDKAEPAPPPSETPTTRWLERQRRAAAAGARALETRDSPVLAGSAEIGIRGQASELFPVYRLSVSLSVPLWDGGQQRARAAMQRAEADELATQLEAAERAEREQTERLRTELRVRSEELELALTMLRSAELLLSQAEERYQLGGGGFEPVLDAQRRLAEAELEVLDARIARLSALLASSPVGPER